MILESGIVVKGIFSRLFPKLLFMKSAFALSMLLIATSTSSIAQGGDSIKFKGVTIYIDAPAKRANEPLFVIRLGSKKFQIDTEKDEGSPVSIKEIKAVWIESVDILKGNEATEAFADHARNGVVVITLREASRQEMPNSLLAGFKDP
jgi:hypothetical protein